jgi:hypothetical protein
MKDLMLKPVFKPQFIVTGSCNAAYACFLDASPVNGVDLGKSPHVLLTARDSTDSELVLTCQTIRSHNLAAGLSDHPDLQEGKEAALIAAVRAKIPDVSCARLSLIISYLSKDPELPVEQAVTLLIDRIFAIYDRDLLPVFAMNPSIEQDLRRLADGNGPNKRGQWRGFCHTDYKRDGQAVTSLEDPMLQLWLTLGSMDKNTRLDAVDSVLPVLQLACVGEKLSTGVPQSFESQACTLGIHLSETFWVQLDQIAQDLANATDNRFRNGGRTSDNHVTALLLIRHISSHSVDPGLGYHARLYKLLLLHYGKGKRPKLFEIVRRFGEIYREATMQENVGSRQN